jgi:hypothetical protein
LPPCSISKSDQGGTLAITTREKVEKFEPGTRMRRRRTAMKKPVFEYQPVRDFVYFTVMIGTSGAFTYMIYLYSSGMI